MRIITKNLVRLLILTLALTALMGCRSLNSRLDCDSADYTQAKELPPLKFPRDALAVSKRYDIPAIPNEDAPVTDQIYPPPDYIR